MFHHLCASLSTHVGQVQPVGVKKAFTLLSDDEDVMLVDINNGDGLNAFRGARAKRCLCEKSVTVAVIV